MARLSKGIPYFDINTDLNDDKRIKLLRAEFGIKGFGIWIELIRQIYADEGYFMVWDRDTKLLFASDVGESGGLVDEVVNGSVKRGLFNKAVFDQFNVLTSKHIQEKYFNAIKRRTSITEVDARYLVIPADDNIIKGNVYIKLLNVNISAQSRVDESKVITNTHTTRARGENPSSGYQPQQIPLPETVEDVIHIGAMKAIPLEHYRLSRASTCRSPFVFELSPWLYDFDLLLLSLFNAPFLNRKARSACQLSI